MARTVRIANACGYWGDDLDALTRQVRGGPLDYVTLELLAEITMVLLARQRERDPSAGFPREVLDMLRPALPDIAARGIRIVTNAGGVNPRACAVAVDALCRDQGLRMRIAVVEGDDLLGRLEELRTAGTSLAHLDTGAAFAPIASKVVSAHAYLGARPIAAALAAGAQIVITGRVVDAALTVGPLVHEFGWRWDDWQRLAGATVAGHLIECGAQVTGGNLTDWDELPDLRGIGYPIAEVADDGSFVLTKHAGTGGAVNVKTVTEQLLYEIGDPRAYLTPDVTVDLTGVTATEVDTDRVMVTGARGRPPPACLKASIVHADGYRAAGMVLLSGPDVLAKGRALADMVWSRMGRFAEQRTDFIGYDSCWGAAAHGQEPSEVLLRFAARDSDRSRLRRFSRLLLGLMLQGPPGLGIAAGRPEVSEAYAYWPALVPRSPLAATVSVLDGSAGPQNVTCRAPETSDSSCTAPAGDDGLPSLPRLSGRARRVRLRALALARSGDKGDVCNIGVAARSGAAYAFLGRHLTAERVQKHFGDMVGGRARRYLLPGLRAFNFVLERALGGGGTLSLRVDHQGKTWAQGLLTMPLEVDEAVLATVPPPRPSDLL